MSTSPSRSAAYLSARKRLHGVGARRGLHCCPCGCGDQEGSPGEGVSEPTICTDAFQGTRREEVICVRGGENEGL